jgi:2-(1,2-epoxy-1,2-dihydrophenyl)acetyl-CoA isomerase
MKADFTDSGHRNATHGMKSLSRSMQAMTDQSRPESPSEPDTVTVETDAAVATIRLNRPKALNALTTTMRKQLLAALQQVGADAAIRCVVLTGAGRAFSVGQDLTEHADNLSQGDLNAMWEAVPVYYNQIALAIHRMDKPVVAAVNGIAAGAAASIAFLTDYRIVAASAGFSLAFPQIGLSCDTGASYTLPRLVGPAKAMELFLNPRTVGADEAQAIGIASEVAADDDFLTRVRDYAAGLAAGPTLAYAAMRHSISYAARHDLEETLNFEASMMKQTGTSTDHRRAVEAFLAKQEPTFAGR